MGDESTGEMVHVIKLEREFHRPLASWVSDGGPVSGIWAQVLAEDLVTGAYTGLHHYDPGVDTSPLGTRVHDYWEEVYILEGDLTDPRLGKRSPQVCMPADRQGWRTGHGGPSEA